MQRTDEHLPAKKKAGGASRDIDEHTGAQPNDNLARDSAPREHTGDKRGGRAQYKRPVKVHTAQQLEASQIKDKTQVIEWLAVEQNAVYEMLPEIESQMNIVGGNSLEERMILAGEWLEERIPSRTTGNPWGPGKDHIIPDSLGRDISKVLCMLVRPTDAAQPDNATELANKLELLVDQCKEEIVNFKNLSKYTEGMGETEVERHITKKRKEENLEEWNRAETAFRNLGNHCYDLIWRYYSSAQERLFNYSKFIEDLQNLPKVIQYSLSTVAKSKVKQLQGSCERAKSKVKQLQGSCERAKSKEILLETEKKTQYAQDIERVATRRLNEIRGAAWQSHDQTDRNEHVKVNLNNWETSSIYGMARNADARRAMEAYVARLNLITSKIKDEGVRELQGKRSGEQDKTSIWQRLFVGFGCTGDVDCCNPAEPLESSGANGDTEAQGAKQLMKLAVEAHLILMYTGQVIPDGFGYLRASAVSVLKEKGVWPLAMHTTPDGMDEHLQSIEAAATKLVEKLSSTQDDDYEGAVNQLASGPISLSLGNLRMTTNKSEEDPNTDTSKRKFEHLYEQLNQCGAASSSGHGHGIDTPIRGTPRGRGRAAENAAASSSPSCIVSMGGAICTALEGTIKVLERHIELSDKEKTVVLRSNDISPASRAIMAACTGQSKLLRQMSGPSEAPGGGSSRKERPLYYTFQGEPRKEMIEMTDQQIAVRVNNRRQCSNQHSHYPASAQTTESGVKALQPGNEAANGTPATQHSADGHRLCSTRPDGVGSSLEGNDHEISREV